MHRGSSLMEYKFSDKMTTMKPSAIREIFKSLTDPSIISFAAGNPSPLSFPADDLGGLAGEIFEKDAAVALQYGITEGYAPLIEDVDRRMREKFSIDTSIGQTIITSGGQQAIELACKVLCNEGDTVLCENPTFIGALNAFRSNGARVRGIPITDSGIDIPALEAALDSDDSIRMIYVIPTFHNPAGITSSEENRRRLYDAALRHGVIILEDNPYGELRFSGNEAPAIKSFDTHNIVLYCSSFSKILSAGMRIGYINGPREIIGKMVIAKQVEDVHTNLFFQILCHRYITTCDLDSHILEIKKLYGRKCALMLESLDRFLPKSIKYTRPDGGLFIWCTLPDGKDSSEFVNYCVKRGVATVPGATFNCDENALSDSFRLNYSMPSDEDIVRGVKILGDCARELSF